MRWLNRLYGPFHSGLKNIDVPSAETTAASALGRGFTVCKGYSVMFETANTVFTKAADSKTWLCIELSASEARRWSHWFPRIHYSKCTVWCETLVCFLDCRRESEAFGDLLYIHSDRLNNKHSWGLGGLMCSAAHCRTVNTRWRKWTD